MSMGIVRRIHPLHILTKLYCWVFSTIWTPVVAAIKVVSRFYDLEGGCKATEAFWKRCGLGFGAVAIIELFGCRALL